jgi:hypothetical protein
MKDGDKTGLFHWGGYLWRLEGIGKSEYAGCILFSYENRVIYIVLRRGGRRMRENDTVNIYIYICIYIVYIYIYNRKDYISCANWFHSKDAWLV